MTISFTEVHNKEEFISASLLNNSKRIDTDYSLFEFTAYADDCEFICKKHNRQYTQKLHLHLKGTESCPLCFTNSGSRLTQEELSNKIVERLNKRYTLLSFGKNLGASVTVLCCDCGETASRPATKIKQHIIFCSCNKVITSRLTKEDAISNLKAIAAKHNLTWHSDLDTYVNKQSKFQLECTACGHRTIKEATVLMRKGWKCACNANVTTEKTFIEKCSKIHNNRYDYSKVVFNTILEKYTITCKVHGDFQQQGSAHLYLQQGCPKCANRIIRGDSAGSLYILLLSHESFGKVLKFGITYKSVESRAHEQKLRTNSSGASSSPVDYKLLYSKDFPVGVSVYDIEQHIRSTYICGIVPKEVLPHGYTETTSVDNYEDIVSYIEAQHTIHKINNKQVDI